jgi:predicted RNA-binding protein with PIN domain
MALVRILVDGYSLLHRWPALAPGRARHSAGARDALLARLRRYRDATAVSITVIFDGYGAPAGTPKHPSTPELEVLFSGPGRTADDLIERAAYRLRPYGEVLVVTDDLVERDTVTGFGALTASCAGFIAQLETELGDAAADLNSYNRRERERFRQGR